MSSYIRSIFLLLLFNLFVLESCDPGVWILKPSIDENIKILNQEVVEITKNDITLRANDAVLNGGLIFPNWVFIHIEIINNRLAAITIDPTKFEMEIRGKKIGGLSSDQPVPSVVSEFKRLGRTVIYPGQSIDGYLFFTKLKFPFKDDPIILRLNNIIDVATKEELDFEILLARVY